MKLLVTKLQLLQLVIQTNIAVTIGQSHACDLATDNKPDVCTEYRSVGLPWMSMSVLPVANDPG